MIPCCRVRAKASIKNVQCSYYLNVEILRSGESPCVRGENLWFFSGIRSGRREREWGDVGTAETLKQSKISLLS